MTMIKKLRALAFGAAMMAATGTIAQAATASGNLDVNMTINANCSVSASSLSFVAATFVDTNQDATSTLTVRCTSGTFYYITMGMGANSTGTPAVRRMKANTADFLSYSLFTDATRATPWLSSVTTAPTPTAGVSGAPSGTGTGANQQFTVYGRVPPATAAPGTYSDTVAITVTY